MTTFVASNGVELIWCGCVSDKQPGDGCKEVHEARKEFYQHLRDQEPKPWHSAIPGEIWVLEFGGDKRAYARTATLFTNWDAPSLLPTDTGIKSGYRVWPEGDSDG